MTKKEKLQELLSREFSIIIEGSFLESNLTNIYNEYDNEDLYEVINTLVRKSYSNGYVDGLNSKENKLKGEC